MITYRLMVETLITKGKMYLHDWEIWQSPPECRAHAQQCYQWGGLLWVSWYDAVWATQHRVLATTGSCYKCLTWLWVFQCKHQYAGNTWDRGTSWVTPWRKSQTKIGFLQFKETGPGVKKKSMSKRKKQGMVLYYKEVTTIHNMKTLKNWP